MKNGAKRVGIMGGTFNPIHIGHLVTAEEAVNQFDLDEVIFMPTSQPPHKENAQLLPDEERYLMTVIATASNPKFTVSKLEIEREGHSYTIDTIKTLHSLFGKNTLIYFITGADAVLEILSWKEPELLSAYCSFIAATRPGYNLKKFHETLKSEVQNNLPKIHLMEIPALAISSTDIRARIRTNMPITYLTPQPVVSYIYKNGFYKD